MDIRNNEGKTAFEHTKPEVQKSYESISSS